MSKTKSRSTSTSGSYETRLVAAQSFTPSDRVIHRVTGKVGAFQEINLGYALPEVWVQFESDSEISVPTSCNPLDLELMNSDPKQHEELSSNGKSASSDDEKVITVEAIATAVEVLEELTPQEANERHRLELKVERAFIEAGAALRELQERKLYRSTHKTFEAYCRERFNYSRDTAYLKIAAATVYDNIQELLPTIGRQIPMPTNERQLRDIAKAGFKPEIQVSAWIQGVEESGGKVPSGRIVKGIVERLKSKPLYSASDFCSVGDVFTLIRLEGAERKYNGCWAIASHINDFTLGVDVHDGTILVKPENLKPIDEPDVRRQLSQTLRRIRRLRNVGLLDRGAYNVLEDLGRHTYLTDFEDDLLTFMEQRYGVED